jgi:cell division protein FtsL
MLWRTSLAAVLLVAAVAAATAPATAQQQQICLTLEAQLAALERQDTQAAYQNLQAQYSQAQQAYNQTYAQAQQMGCIRLLQFNVPATCSGILAQLNSQDAQLNQLRQQLQALAPNQNAAARDNILRALAANNCGPQYAPYANQGGLGGLLDRLFGLPQNGAVGNDNLVPLVTTYRTICVRGCDGYYFPLSFSTTPAHFETDQQICEAQCPGAQLYYYENPGAPVETAVSINGEPITDLPNAFAFRLAYYPECKCQPVTPIPAVQNFTPLPQETTDVVATVTPAIPLPVPRPDPSEDPETIANRLGGFTPGPFTLADNDVAAAMMVNDEGLRLIGPAYLYAQ